MVAPPPEPFIPDSVSRYVITATGIGLRVTCKHHVDCIKFRSLQFGDHKAYLARWLAAGSILSKEEHRLYKP